MPIERIQSKRSLSVGILFNILATVLLRCISLITAPITTRLLNTEQYGIMAIFNTWASVAVVIAGLQTLGTLNNARVKYDDTTYRDYCANSMLLSFAGHVCFGALVFLFRAQLAALLKLPVELILLITPYAFFQYCVSFLSAYLLIDTKTLKNALACLFVTGLSVGLSVWLASGTTLYQGEPHMAFIYGHFFVNAAFGLVIFVWFALRGKWTMRKEYASYCLKLSVPLVFHGLASMVFGQSDRVMLQQQAGYAEAGVYSIVYSFTAILASVWSAVNAVWVPFYYDYLGKREYTELLMRSRNFDRLFVGLTAGFVLVAPEVFKLLAAPDYWTMLDIIPVLVMAYVLNHMYAYPTNYEFFMEKSKWIAIGTVGAGIVNVLLNALLIPRLGGMGAAVATTISYMALYAFHTLIARRFIGGYPLPLKDDLLRFLVPLAVCVLSELLKDVWLVRWLLAVGVGGWLVYSIVRRKAVI